MTALLSVFVPGKPETKLRARHGKTRSGAPITYSDPKSASYENWIALMVRQEWTAPTIEEPVVLTVVAHIERPKKPKHKRHPGSRPDLDNYLKAAMDGITRAGVWKDDSLVCRLEATKRWSESPGMAITIALMDDGEDQ